MFIKKGEYGLNVSYKNVMGKVSEIKEAIEKQEKLLIKTKIQDVLEAAKVGENIEGEEYGFPFEEVNRVVRELYKQGLEEGKDFFFIETDPEDTKYQVVLKVNGKYLSLYADDEQFGMRNGSNEIPVVSEKFTEKNINNLIYGIDVDEVLRHIEQLKEVDLDKVLFPELESERSAAKDDAEILNEGTLDEKIARNEIEIKKLETKLKAIQQENQYMINEKAVGELLKDIREGNFIEDYSLWNNGVDFDRLAILEDVYYKYGEELLFPTTEIDLDQWGEAQCYAGMIMKVNGKFIVDGTRKFDSFEELINCEELDGLIKQENLLKIKTLKDISIPQLEAMLEGRDIGQDTRDRRVKFEEALIRDDVIDYFLNQSPEEIEATYGRAVAEMVGFDQNNPHHCYDLFEHTLNTVAGIDTTGLSKEDAIKLKVAAFFHDLGKPQVAMPKNGNTVFYGHAKKSAEASKEILQMFDYEPKEIEQLQFLIGHHDDFINFKREDEEWNRKNRFLRGISLETVARKIQETKEDAAIYNEYNPSKKDYELLLRLCIADANAQSRVVRDHGRVIDSRANKVDRLSQIQGLVPKAYDLSLEMTAKSIKNIGIPESEKVVEDRVTAKVKGTSYLFGDGRKKIEVPEDIRKYEQSLRETYIHDGGPDSPALKSKLAELFDNGMTQEQFSRVSEILGFELKNKVIGGIEEIHKGGKLTQLFDVKKALIERNEDAEKLLQQYENRLKIQGIREDK